MGVQCPYAGQDRGEKINASYVKGVLLLTAVLGAACAARAADGDLQELGQMLLERPDVPVTAPQEAPPPPEELALPACGSAVVNRRCRIEYRSDAGWYLLTLLPRRSGEQVYPRWVLPSEFLPAIEQALAENPRASFRVSGETTCYHGRVFILLREVMVDRPPDPDATDSSAQESPPAPDSAPEPTSREGTRADEDTNAAEGPDPTDGAQDEILAALLSDRPGKPLAAEPRRQSVAPAASVAPADRPQLSEDRGQMRVDRLIVMVRDESDQWWEARFESDNTLQDQPVRLLPCRLLERAEKLVAAGAHEVVRLRVSGELIDHAGCRYMLLRKVLVQHDMGQF